MTRGNDICQASFDELQKRGESKRTETCVAGGRTANGGVKNDERQRRLLHGSGGRYALGLERGNDGVRVKMFVYDEK